MALEEWKEFVGNSATFFTILQFLMGMQVKKWIESPSHKYKNV